MKKTIAALLAAVLLILLCGCTPQDDSQINPGEDDAQTLDTALLWSSLDGVWAGNDGVFIWICTEEDGTLSYTTGILFSGFVMGGALTQAKQTASDTYELEIFFPARAANDEDSGWDEFTASVNLISHLNDDPKTIEATDIATDGSVRTFMYRGKDMDEATGSAQQTQTTYTDLREAWSALNGLWARNDDGSLRFVLIQTESGDVYSLSVGTLYSGDLTGGEVTQFIPMDGQQSFIAEVYVPALENMEMSRDEFIFTCTVDYAELYNNVLHVTLKDGDGAPAYTYIGAGFADIDNLSMNDIYSMLG